MHKAYKPKKMSKKKFAKENQEFLQALKKLVDTVGEERAYKLLKISK